MEENSHDDDDVNDQSIYGNQDAIIFDKLLRSGKVLHDVYQDYDSQPHAACNYDNEDYIDDFSSDEEDEEEKELIEAQPQQDETVRDWNTSSRPPFPTPRNQEKQDECEDDIYLLPIEPTSSPDPPSTQGRRLPGLQQPTSQLPSSLKNVPWETGRHNIVTDSQRPKPLAERGPAPLPHQITSQSKKPSNTSSPSLPPRLKPMAPNRLPFPGSNNRQIVGFENGRGGGSPFQRGHQENKPNNPWNKESAWTPSQEQENDAHVYEPVDNLAISYQTSQTPASNVPDWKSPVRQPVPALRNQNQDFDDQGLSSQLGAISLTRKTQPVSLPGLSRKPSNEGSEPGSGQSSRSSSPRQINLNRPPKPLPYHCRESQESQAPQELAPSLPKEDQPYVKLDDEEIILITPLYKRIMELPYFHMISRGKAKLLMTNGDDGMFLIRPSTRTKNPLTLTLKQDNRHYNIIIRLRPDSLFALGAEKPQEKTFSSVAEIVSTYKREPIKLKNGKGAYFQTLDNIRIWRNEGGA